MSSVWVIETGDYEQRGVFGVAVSPEAAAACVKDCFTAPYIVRWDEPTEAGITGHFRSVPNYSISHTARFDFTEHEVYTLLHITRLAPA